MGSFLVKLLTNPENFKFYSGNSEGQVGNVSSADSFGQKSIPFGKDRPGGGSSNQPYIKGVGLTGTGTKTVGDAWGNFINAWSQPGLLPFNAAFFKPTNGIGPAGLVQNTFNQFASFGPLAGSLVYAVDDLPNIPDSIIRGGTKSLPRSVIDATRLTKYFLDYKSVNGVLFLAKQNLLSRVSVKTEPARAGAAYLFGVLNGGLYTPLSTIGQAATGFAGIHLNEKGIDPTGIIPQLSIRDYQKVAFNRNKGDISNENSKGYQKKVDRKLNKIQKLRDQLRTSRELLQTSQNYDPTTDPQYKGEWSGQDGKIYQSQEAAIKSIISAKRIGTGAAQALYYFSTGEEFNLNDLTEQETKLIQQAKSEDQKIKKAREKAIKDDKDQEAFLTKQVKKLPEQILDIEEELEELTLGGKYKNRLLRLWDKFGLDITNPVESDATTLLSYGGGPGSILGIGKTKIKFATLNDGITPARTGYNLLDPYAGVYLNHGPNNQSIFSPDFIYGIGPNGRGNSIFFKSKYSAEDYFGDPDYISKLSNSSKLLEDNSFILQPWAVKITYATDPTQVSLVNGSPISSKRYSTWNPALFKLQPKNDIGYTTSEDFRKDLNIEEGYTFLSISPSYIDKNIERRLGLGKKSGGPGAPGKRTNYSIGKLSPFNTYLGPLDTINALPIYRSGQDEEASPDLIEDIIPFKISILDNENPSKFFHVHLRAFIDNFSDSFSSQWKKIEYMGRGEKFFKYGGFDRDISIGFTVAAQSKEELIPIYRKLNFLASSLTPFYTKEGYMAGNIAYLTLGDYFTNQAGVINSMGIDIDKDSPWEIGIDVNGNRDENVPRLPFMVKVKMKFTPIHQFRPEINKIGGTPDPNNLTTDNLFPDNSTTYANQRYISNVGWDTGDDTNPLYKPSSPRPQLTNVFNNNVKPPSDPDNAFPQPQGALDENIFYNNQNYLFSSIGSQPLSSQNVLNQTPNASPIPDLTSTPSPGSPFEGASDSAFSFTPSIPLP